MCKIGFCLEVSVLKMVGILKTLDDNNIEYEINSKRLYDKYLELKKYYKDEYIFEELITQYGFVFSVFVYVNDFSDMEKLGYKIEWNRDV